MDARARRPMRMSTVVFVLGLLTTISLALEGRGEERSDAARGKTNTSEELPKTRQLLVVLTDTWKSNTGTLRRFSMDRARELSSPAASPLTEEHWLSQGDEVPVSLGRNGLAWGRGSRIEAREGHPWKREGDGKSPAGVFSLGTAFGAEKELPESSHGYPYLPVSSTDYCVEDVRSEFYNQLIDSTLVNVRGWRKWSPLERADGLFRWGVFVNQNTESTQVGAGSCIFLHIWRGPGIGTSGCTAMPSAVIGEVVRWLDPHAAPLLIQLPREVYLELASQHHWPLQN